MSMMWVRKYYKVPAKRGMLVCFYGVFGWITSASNYLRIKPFEAFGRRGRTVNVHPYDDIAYMLESGQWFYTDVSPKTITACETYRNSLDY